MIIESSISHGVMEPVTFSPTFQRQAGRGSGPEIKRAETDPVHQARRPSPRSAWDCRTSMPVLGNVERPFKLEMGHVVIVDKPGHRLIMTSGQHSRRSFFWCERFGI